MRRHLIEAFGLAVVLTALSYVVALASGWIETVNTPLGWLEVFAVFTSYACTWLCVRQRRINYPIGALSTAAYAVLFWQFGLYGSAIINAWLSPYLLYGWIRWRRDAIARPVHRVQARWVPAYVSVTAAVAIGGYFLAAHFGYVMPAADIVIFAGSILAQLLLDNKKLETWIVWSVVDIVAIAVYFKTGIFLSAFQYVFFLANTVIGYRQWRRSMTLDRIKFLVDNSSLGDPEAKASRARGDRARARRIAGVKTKTWWRHGLG